MREHDDRTCNDPTIPPRNHLLGALSPAHLVAGRGDGGAGTGGKVQSIVDCSGRETREARPRRQCSRPNPERTLMLAYHHAVRTPRLEAGLSHGLHAGRVPSCEHRPSGRERVGVDGSPSWDLPSQPAARASRPHGPCSTARCQTMAWVGFSVRSWFPPSTRRRSKRHRRPRQSWRYRRSTSPHGEVGPTIPRRPDLCSAGHLA